MEHDLHLSHSASGCPESGQWGVVATNESFHPTSGLCSDNEDIGQVTFHHHYEQLCLLQLIMILSIVSASSGPSKRLSLVYASGFSVDAIGVAPMRGGGVLDGSSRLSWAGLLAMIWSHLDSAIRCFSDPASSLLSSLSSDTNPDGIVITFRHVSSSLASQQQPWNLSKPDAMER